MNRKNRMPLVEKLHEYVQADSVRLHVPGHKGNLPTINEPAAAYFNSLLPIDLTELTGLDDLHAPAGIIAEAQRLAARCFHAEQTYFLVNGTTLGNLAMILGTIEQGDYVLVQRNSHKSIFNALALAKAQAVFLEPKLCPTFGIPIGLTVEQVQVALQQYPQAKALILTYPNYYGMALPLEELIRVAHAHDLLVLVDEAHGAHFGQFLSLPPAAMQLGADVSVQSTHKMLSSLTQTSMLHIQGSRVVREDIEYYLHSLQSSSPSYPLMASLDLARAQLERMDASEWKRALGTYARLREELANLSAFHISSAGLVKGHPWGISQDPFKLIIQPRRGILSGYELQQELEAAGIFTELADPLNVLCTLPLVVNEQWNTRLLEALSKLAKKSYSKLKEWERGEGEKILTAKQVSTKAERQHPPGYNEKMPNDYQPKQEFSSVQLEIIRQKDIAELPVEQAIGKIAAEMIVPYPPGIPILFPGEIISQEIVTHIQRLQQNGATIQGKGKARLTNILVKKQI